MGTGHALALFAMGVGFAAMVDYFRQVTSRNWAAPDNDRGEAVRTYGQLCGWLAVANAIGAMAAWLNHFWLVFWFCTLLAARAAWLWWHNGGDDDWRKRRRQIKAWVRSCIPRPVVVRIRLVGGAA
jgi:hypothetical protein